MSNNNQYIFATSDKYLYDASYEKKIPFSPELSKFPSVSSFNTEEEYDYSVHSWKKRIKQDSKKSLIPLPLSLSVYAPEVANISNANIKSNQNDNYDRNKNELKYFDYRCNPPLPVAFSELFDVFLKDDQLKNGNKFFDEHNVHIRNQKEVPMNIYAHNEQKWGSLLIPREPSPELFENYESYKKSLKNWASLQNKNESLLHPSEFISLIGIIHSENENYQNTNKTKSLDTNEEKKENLETVNNVYKIFNPDEFLKMKSRKTPPSPLLKQLFSLTYKDVKNNSSLSVIKYSDFIGQYKEISLPFKIPFTKNAIINQIDESAGSNSESSRFVRLLHAYKCIADPLIDQIFINDINPNTKISLFSNLSISQTDSLLRSLTSLQFDELINRLPFFLHQLHIVNSNRDRCRIFVIITNILENKPKLISTFFTDIPTLSNVTSIIKDFALLDTKIYTFTEFLSKRPAKPEIVKTAKTASPGPKSSSANDSPLVSRSTSGQLNSPSETATKEKINTVSISPMSGMSSPLRSSTPPITDTSPESSNFPGSKRPISKRTIFGVSTKRNSISNVTPNVPPKPTAASKRKSSFALRSTISESIPPPNPNDVRKSIVDLTLFLFANQLSKVLTLFVEKYQPKNRNLLLQINAQTMTFSKFIDLSLTQKANEIQYAFLEPTPNLCLIFHFLCDYNPVSLSKLFLNTPFYIFLGKVHSIPECRPYFGELCGHILRHSNLRHIFFLQFFHLHCWLSSKTMMMTIVPVCSFLASLVKVESDSEHDITTDELFTAFTNITQLVRFSPSSSLNLIRSIIVFFMKMKPKIPINGSSTNSLDGDAAANAGFNSNANMSMASANYGNADPNNNTFMHIRESLLTLFKDPNLDSDDITMLYELINLMILPYRNDTKSFLERYLSSVVLVNMKSTNEKVAVEAWKVFRSLFFDQNYTFLRDLQSIKVELSLIVSKKNLPPSFLIEILFLALGVSQKNFSFTSSAESNKKKKVRRSINIFDQPEGFIIPGTNPRDIYQEVLKHAAEGHLNDYKNELMALNVMMPSFKWRKRTISYV